MADLVATTGGIIFHLWSHDDKVPEWQSDDRAIGGTREPYASRVEEGCSEERGGKGVWQITIFSVGERRRDLAGRRRRYQYAWTSSRLLVEVIPLLSLGGVFGIVPASWATLPHPGLVSSRVSLNECNAPWYVCRAGLANSLGHCKTGNSSKQMLLPSTPVDSAVPHSSGCDAASGQSQNTEPGVPAKEKVRRDSTLIERAQLRGENVENCNPINNALARMSHSGGG